MNSQYHEPIQNLTDQQACQVAMRADFNSLPDDIKAQVNVKMVVMQERFYKGECSTK